MANPLTHGLIPPPTKPRGGRRPGAGAPRGNLNALKTGRYSRRLRAISAALLAMPHVAGLLSRMAARDRRKMELIGHGLHFYGDVLHLLAKTGSIDDLTPLINALGDPQLRRRAMMAISIKQSDKRRTRPAPPRNAHG